MSSLTIRKLDNRIKDGLRVRAASNGVSMEEEARRILASAVDGPAESHSNLADVIAGIMDPIGGVELDLPPRLPRRELFQFDEWAEDDDRS